MPLFRLPAALDRWFLPYLSQSFRRWAPLSRRPVHLLLAVCDHYEPNLGGASDEVARRRVDRWVNEYPERFAGFRDADGRPPRHSFFYPVETYHSDHLDRLTELCRHGFGEVEVHLHHDNDTAEKLRTTLAEARDRFVSRHGQLARDSRTGEIRYGFIHGNWALDNSLPDGSRCGVNDELDVLRETGCYADFTMPAAPNPAQTRTINSLYYAVDDPTRPKSHDTGTRVGRGPQPPNSLLLIQGPLGLNWSSRKWGFVPRMENGCLQGNQPASAVRLNTWLRARIQVPTRPDWFFVKLHTHGANEGNMTALLGEPMVRFHQDLARTSAENPLFQYHYVTAREMYNLIRAAEAGWTGGVDGARDYELVWNGAAVRSAVQ